MDDQNTATKALEQPQQASPLMKLPTELRIQIYALAFEHTMDKIATDKDQLHPVTWQREGYKLTPFYSGAFALPHTNRTLRAESLDTLAGLALARVDQLLAESASRHNSAAQRLNAANAEGFNAFALALAETFEEAMKLNKSIYRLGYICGVMGWERGG
jgi:hypothetical protein